MTGVKALLFILVAFALWFAFVFLAQVVLTCAPAGCSLTDLRFPSPMGRRQILVTAVTLVTALWVSSRIFFSSDDGNA